MGIGVGLLTFDHLRTGRAADFRRTLRSITREKPDQFVLLTNGSTDGTQDVVRDLGGIVDDTDRRIFYGNTRLIEELRGNEIIVLSADDLEYREGWLWRLCSFIEAAPPDIVLFSAYLEPVWDWNKPIEAVEYGGERAVLRESVCGSSWAFRSADWDFIGPFPQTMPGEDLEVCQRLSGDGYKFAALDLCEHIGQDRSAWGNQSHLYATEFDREAWGLARNPSLTHS